jgi:hypothetical protein
VILGPILLAVVIVIVLPVSFLLTGGVIAGIYSWLAPDAVDASHEGSELIALNK